MKLLVCGGRNYNDKERLFKVLDKFHEHCFITEVIHGGASGADSLAGLWAEDRGVKVTEYKADWKMYGRSAGPIRNQKMIEESPHLVIAFPGGDGTNNMMELARKANVKIIQIK